MKKNRLTLKDYFKKGAIPTEANFADLIDSMLNQAEDNIQSLPNNPLSITAVGIDGSLINFYTTDQNNQPQLTWQLKQNPDQKTGLGINDPDANRLFIESGTGKVGIGTDTPQFGLDIKTANGIKLGLEGSGGGQLVLANNPNDNKIYLEAFSTDGSASASELLLTGIHSTSAPKISLIADTTKISGNLGIGTDTPAGKLEVVGEVTINDGNGYAVKSNYMASGSLTIGSITQNYGGGTNYWNPNTAGLLLETLKNTEIAVHDAGTRVASLMYYEGDADNRITIGRNMGWGTISNIILNGNVGIGTAPGGYHLNVNGTVLFTGNYLYANAESAGRLRVGAAWGMPGLYSGDDGAKDLTLGVPAGRKVYLGVATNDAFVEGGTGNMFARGNITTRKSLLLMGTTDGSNASAGEVVGGIGFYGFGQQHGLFSFRAGFGFEMIDCSRDAPTLGYGRESYPYADLKIRNLAQTSSRELKENIVEISSQEAFAALDELQTVKFNFRDGVEKYTQVGFIAEDSPNLVSSPDKKSIRPMDVIAILAKVVKEQQKTIDALNEKMDSLVV